MKFTAVKAIIFPKRYLYLSVQRWSQQVNGRLESEMGKQLFAPICQPLGYIFTFLLTIKLKLSRPHWLPITLQPAGVLSSASIAPSHHCLHLSSFLLSSSLLTSAYVLILTGWDLIFDRIPTSLTQIKVSNI